MHVSSSNSKDPSTGRFTGNSFTLYRDNLIEGALPFMNNRERNCFPFAYWKVPFAFWKVPRFLEGSVGFMEGPVCFFVLMNNNAKTF